MLLRRSVWTDREREGGERERGREERERGREERERGMEERERGGREREREETLSFSAHARCHVEIVHVIKAFGGTNPALLRWRANECEVFWYTSGIRWRQAVVRAFQDEASH
jgi:hypothetical protein